MSRWTILAVLFLVRCTMGYQFQSVASVAPFLVKELGLTIADVGLLIGLYLTPGIVIALPGGALGRTIGDKRAVLAGLALMVAGGVAMALAGSYEAQLGGRLLAGIGGVLLNVVMSKMVQDWFAGREIATAMATFANAWPAGIALALVTTPSLAAASGTAAAFAATAIAAAAGLLLLAAAYRAPPAVAAAGHLVQARPTGAALWATLTAGALWATYNMGFAMVFGFGPSLLVERGWTPALAGSAVSTVLWLSVLSVPAGGILADRTGRHGLVLVGGCLAMAVILLAILGHSSPLPLLVALGLLCGLPAGPILSLPSRVLTPATRAIGMGLFFTVFYLGNATGPILAGAMSRWSGTIETALVLGAAFVTACACLYAVFCRLATRSEASVPVPTFASLSRSVACQCRNQEEH